MSGHPDVVLGHDETGRAAVLCQRGYIGPAARPHIRRPGGRRRRVRPRRGTPLRRQRCGPVLARDDVALLGHVCHRKVKELLEAAKRERRSRLCEVV